MAKPRSIESILLHLDKIKQSMAQGHIFRTEPKIKYWIEISIFEMMKAQRRIDGTNLKNWVNYNAPRNGTKTTNVGACNEVIKLWSGEIEKHNNSLFKNQKSLF